MRGLFFLLFIAFCLYLFVNVEPHQIERIIKEQPLSGQIFTEREEAEDKVFTQADIQKNEQVENISTYMGEGTDVIIDSFGEPDRKDLSAFDYEWWIYNSNFNNYIQIGIIDNRVVTIFSTGSESNNGAMEIGENYDTLNEKFDFSDSVTVEHEEGSYQFIIKSEESTMRPLIKLEDFYVQLYFDDIDKTLSSVRYLDSETLIKQRPYELVYRGPLLEAKELSQEELERVEAGNAQQILDFTNIIRERFNLSAVEWDQDVAEVAFFHSKDMRDSDYFSHTSPTRGSLTDRLMEGDVPFRLAGENIAAKYVDGIAATEGWLNSEGHRNTLLNSQFTHLGVGVSENYYTQNFIQIW
ncbi:CAP domain-containing protein [Sutcliffiella rhizosphaerae]|uniref:CAP domain-containing protein n=1 Tax=Sutcliffiella rhizosphaerae TaxID=2880967 RepID=A0ABM8YIZ2_9BACI|nr:CAP domain-containing protein [Sutcliffiella rhizosphaerae]CAG9619841.1 hypothetical protein BACCIP111883_00609 [Sutcliffiella rhizosphaerae]